ncbi:MAG: SGNH/GDSL hydrolase family protein [Nitrospira sp.]|nr:SGNH/GDSL hydrolase family protein [Nitrospira sp.]
MYQRDWIDLAAYEHVPESYVSEVLDDFFDLAKMGFTYQPWAHFSEPLFAGKRVHVVHDQLGFPTRLTMNPPNEQGRPEIRIFVLGGSTTFGYNVSDEHTFPTHLSAVLNERARAENLVAHIEVTNYGRGFYYPSQETALLIDLLRMGHRPNLVIFMDGVNLGDLQDLPPFYSRFERRFRSMQFSGLDPANQSASWISERLGWIPMVRVTKAIQNRMSAAPKKPEEEQEKEDFETRHGVNMFRQNQLISRAVCQAYKIECLFFLQPNAVFNYPTQLWRRSLPKSFMKSRDWLQLVYAQMQQDEGRIYLGDLFRLYGEGRKAIVDDCHYSPGFGRFLAEHVAKYVNLGRLVPGASGIKETEATGTARTSN